MDEPTAASVVALVSALVARATTTAAATPTHTRGRRPPLPPPAARARRALDAATLIAGLRPGFLVDYGGPAFRDQAGLAALAAGLTSLLLAREGGSGSVRLARLGGGDGDGGGDDDDGDDDGFSSAPALFLVRLPMECAPLRSPWPVFVGLTPPRPRCGVRTRARSRPAWPPRRPPSTATLRPAPQEEEEEG